MPDQHTYYTQTHVRRDASCTKDEFGGFLLEVEWEVGVEVGTAVPAIA